MYNRRYDKVFILLRQEGEGSPSRRSPGGNCVLELRNGRVRGALFAQNLRRLSDGRYVVYLIAAGPEDAPGARAGELLVDDRGQGRLRWECSADDVLGSGEPLERFNTLAVVVEGPASTGVPTAPLCGYTFDRKNWRPYFRRFGETPMEPAPVVSALRAEASSQAPIPLILSDVPTQTIPQAENEPGLSAQVPASPAPMSPAESSPAGPAPDSPSPLPEANGLSPLVWGLTAPQPPELDFDQLTSRFQQELAALAAAGPLPSTVPRKAEAQTGAAALAPESPVPAGSLWELTRAAPLATEPPAQDEADHQPSGEPRHREPPVPLSHSVSPSDLLFAGRPSFVPFAEPNPWHWIRIQPREIGFLPQAEPALPNQPLVRHSCQQYHHLLLGRNAAGSFRLGLPDVYDKGVAAQAAQLGFTEFWCCEGGAVYPGKYGYWLRTLQNNE